jgi:hypothetical protein
MMDKMERMLRSLPAEAPSPELSAAIRAAVHRHHRRRQIARLAAAFLMALIGLWLLWPAIELLSSNAPFATGAPWLVGSLTYGSDGSVEMLNGLWDGTFSMQKAIGSTLAFSLWIGALLLCGSIFLALGLSTWQATPKPHAQGGNSTVLARSLHA